MNTQLLDITKLYINISVKERKSTTNRVLRMIRKHIFLFKD